MKLASIFLGLQLAHSAFSMEPHIPCKQAITQQLEQMDLGTFDAPRSGIRRTLRAGFVSFSLSDRNTISAQINGDDVQISKTWVGVTGAQESQLVYINKNDCQIRGIVSPRTGAGLITPTMCNQINALDHNSVRDTNRLRQILQGEGAHCMSGIEISSVCSINGMSDTRPGGERLQRATQR